MINFLHKGYIDKCLNTKFSSSFSKHSRFIIFIEILIYIHVYIFYCLGNYFGTYFIMGGERFDMSQPEAYLFGENTDLNFLGNKPIPVSILFTNKYNI